MGGSQAGQAQKPTHASGLGSGHHVRYRPVGVVFGWIVLGVGMAVGCPAVRADELDRAAQELVARYRVQLQQLAARCESAGLADQARTTRQWLGARDPYRLYVAVLPREVGADRAPAEAPAPVAQWHGEFMQLRREQASALFDLARRAIRTGRASLALDLTLAAVRENPDHPAIRKMLGYQEQGGAWYTVYELRRMRAGQVWHERFGWLPKTFVGRYEQGQRYANGRWVSAEEDAQLHADIPSGWLVETEHYVIRTNHSLEAGVALGQELEKLYSVWSQLFVRYYASEAQVLALFDGRTRGRLADVSRHTVVYFRDREQYNQALGARFPSIGISTGIYVASDRTAYFFAGAEPDRRTLLHEATHQLFHESRPVASNVAARANFWIVEGIAMYMETLKEKGGFFELGGLDDDRTVAARFRLLEDRFYVPLVDFTALGMKQLQSDPRIATLYSQAAGLTHFLIHYDAGRYRDAVVAYLSAVYSGQDDPGLLSRLTGVPYATLDRQYREFIAAAPAPSDQAGPSARLPGLGRAGDGAGIQAIRAGLGLRDAVPRVGRRP